MKKISARELKKDMPEWKRKKDPFLTRLFYRPFSFYISSAAANMGITANSVSYFSVLVAIIGCCLFIFNNYVLAIIGGILFNIWLLLDCVDGNLARSVKKQPFGEFADGISSYILVGLMGIAMSISVFQRGGLFFESGNYLILILGTLASEMDTLMRLVYQKYKSTEKELIEKGIIKEVKGDRKDQEQVSSLKVRIEMEFGIGGILPIAILLATIFNFLDIVIVYCFVYYGLSAVAMILNYIIKARKTEKAFKGDF